MRRVHLTIAFCFLISSSAVAQMSTLAAHGTIVGTVVDSVRGGVLPNAAISLSNSDRVGVSDSLGYFRIDSIAPGAYVVRLSHAFLDTLRAVVSTRSIEVSAGTVTSLLLAVPSPATLVRRKCSSSDQTKGDAGLIGVVSDADTGIPSRGAEIVVTWTDYSVGAKRIDKKPQRRSAFVDEDGGYLICGIPSDLETGIFARRGQDSTAELPVNFATGLVVRSFHLAPAFDSSSSLATLPVSRSTGVVLGTVFDPAGRSVAGARVAIEADNAVTTTAPDGQFRLSGAKLGTRLLVVRKLGYAPKEIAVEIHSFQSQNLAITLSTAQQVLSAVKITAIREIGLQRVGFSERKRTASGTFLGPKEIEGKNSPKLSFLIESIPALKRYSSCMRYWVDGHMWSTVSDADLTLGPDAFLSGAEIAAVEVYGPLTAPPEFIASSKLGACASVVIWTKAKLGY